MSEAKHTPGPWWVGDPKFEEKHRPWTDAVAICGREHPQVVHEHVCWMTRGNNQEANAGLIAAAPDMLAALQDAVAHCYDCGGTGDIKFDAEVPGSIPLDCRHCAKQRAAIAKATGSVAHSSAMERP